MRSAIGRYGEKSHSGKIREHSLHVFEAAANAVAAMPARIVLYFVEHALGKLHWLQDGCWCHREIDQRKNHHEFDKTQRPLAWRGVCRAEKSSQEHGQQQQPTGIFRSAAEPGHRCCRYQPGVASVPQRMTAKRTVSVANCISMPSVATQRR